MEDYVDEGVLDEHTLKTLYRLSSRGVFTALGGVLSTGKEADVFLAERGYEDVAIKIYRVATTRFKEMREHLTGDPRVRGIGGSRHSIVYRWTQREYGNLRRAKEHVRVPEPLAMDKNVLAMEFIGEDELRAPSLRRMEFDDWAEIAEMCVEMLIDLYEGGLVHGDFSEYNVLVFEELVLIDFSQSVTPEHPLATHLLRRDVENLVSFFGSRGVELDECEVLERIGEAL
ncbi:MAG: RIO-type serine/threonine-protein kinase Rio1 [Methanonatronarchaeales archaeon]|nr:RIO-type serine/threonine-protein kinase Rio1 [Methanonatronarchaeales archaeon]